MKNFKEWQADHADIVAMYDAKIHQCRLELEALIAVRNSYASNGSIKNPGAMTGKIVYEPGMEDCGK
jgi:hypothetical protein